MIMNLFRRSKPEPSVERVYGDIVTAARNPALFTAMDVPDTVMGRFESLTLHVSLVLRRLADLPAPANELAQELVDRFFSDLDSALREIGIGDVTVPKKVKKLGQAFYGRAQAYQQALKEAADGTALESALCRNVLDRPDEPDRAVLLAQYVRSLVITLETKGFEDLLNGHLIHDAGIETSKTVLEAKPQKAAAAKARRARS